MAAIGIKHSNAHQGEWPVRFNTMAAGMANNSSPTVMNMNMEVLNGIIGIMIVPNPGAPVGA